MPETHQSSSTQSDFPSARILLLQARHDDDPVKREELESFARRSGVAADQVTSHDILQGPPAMALLRRHDVMMVGGSGEYYVTKNHLPHQQRTLEFLTEVADNGPPTFASCFGFQLMVEALGGELVYDPDAMEVGTYPVRLTEDGRTDELFRGLPEEFPAQLGRKDRARRLPAEARHLAASERAPFQAFRLAGRPLWASQFHPELDHETNRGRYLRYLDGYAGHLTEEEKARSLERFRPSPATETLLHRFLRLVLT
ncbi:MAG: type 1 glutamine amidotransferase [Acidobacteriota bacterium]